MMREARLCRGVELDELGAFLDELGRLVLDQLDAAAQQQLDAVQQAARPTARARELLPRLLRVRVRIRVRVRVLLGISAACVSTGESY